MGAKEHLPSYAILFNVTEILHPAYGKHHRHFSALHETREAPQLANDNAGGVEKVRLERGLKVGLLVLAWWHFKDFYRSFHFQIPKKAFFFRDFILQIGEEDKNEDMTDL